MVGARDKDGSTFWRILSLSPNCLSQNLNLRRKENHRNPDKDREEKWRKESLPMVGLKWYLKCVSNMKALEKNQER